MKQKINLGILFGGKSVEHEISVRSSKNVLDAVDQEKYNVTMIGITKEGKWVLNPEITATGQVTGGTPLAIIIGSEGPQLMDVAGKTNINKLDVIFPILHGPFGEDGTVQGLLKLANIPFVGCGVLGSAVGMDKEVMKRLLEQAEIKSANYLVFNKYTDTVQNPTYQEALEYLGLPMFVKPANCGSSVGISKVRNAEEFEKAIAFAFEFDQKLIVETSIVGKEIECAVLGNEKPIASVPGEVTSNHDFYSYEAKYLDENGAILQIPAKLDKEIITRIQEVAIKTYKTMVCEGLTRVDFFLTPDNELLINEVNSIPGFTNISMYPKLFEATGISYSELIDQLIEFALERFKRESLLKTSIDG